MAASLDKAEETTGGPVARLVANFEAERERWWLWLPVCLGAGIGGYFALPFEPPVWLGVAGLTVFGALGMLCRRRQAAVLLCVALATAFLGVIAAQWRTWSVAAPTLAKRYGPAFVEGQVLAAEPRGAGGGPGARVVLRPLRLPGLEPSEHPAKVRVRLTRRDPLSPAPGDWIRVRAALRAPPPPAAPGAFDFARRAYFERLGAVGYAVGHAEKLPPPEGAGNGTAGWRLWWSSVRHAVAARVLAALPDETGAVAAALMTGERGAIPEPVNQAMRDSGLAHLLAISGLHVGLVAGILFFGLRGAMALVPALALNRPIKKWAAVLAGLGAFVYLFLAGATVPTQRAFLMLAVVLLAVVLDRSAISLRLVAWAAAVVLLIAPESILSASFQMSFAAVTGLVAAYEALRERNARRPRGDRNPAAGLGLYVAGVALTSVIAIAATAPFAVYHFNRLALYGLAANLVAVPLTAFWIMPWAVAAFVLMLFGQEGLALAPMGWGIDLLLGTAEGVAAWPGATTPVRAMPTSGLVLVVLGGLWLCLWRRRWRLLGLAAVLAGLASLPLNRPPDVLASDDGRLLAVRAADGGLWLSSRRRGRFNAETWLRRAGEAEGQTWPRSGAAANGALSCDSLGCIYRKGGWKVALVKDGRALDEDCRLADVVISLVSLPDRLCRDPAAVIDRSDLWRDGGHAVWLEEGGVRVESVENVRGRRPWTRARVGADD